MKFAPVILTALVAVIVTSGPGQAQIVLTGSLEKRTLDCQGQTVEITGSGYDLTIRGACPKLGITGTGNTVRIERVGRIEVTGANNRVTYEGGLEGKSPRVSKTGVGNSVEKATTAEAEGGQARAGGDAIILGSQSRSETVECEGRGVIIQGDENELTLLGPCESVTVNGSRNRLRVDSVGMLETNGDDNHVVWEAGLDGGLPKIVDLGSGNRLTRASE